MHNTELAHRLMELYGTVDNIDVWLGGVAEPFVNGGRVGPLFACIIARQFQRIRLGDRSAHTHTHTLFLHSLTYTHRLLCKTVY